MVPFVMYQCLLPLIQSMIGYEDDHLDKDEQKESAWLPSICPLNKQWRRSTIWFIRFTCMWWKLWNETHVHMSSDVTGDTCGWKDCIHPTQHIRWELRHTLDSVTHCLWIDEPIISIGITSIDRIIADHQCRDNYKLMEEWPACVSVCAHQSSTRSNSMQPLASLPVDPFVLMIESINQSTHTWQVIYHQFNIHSFNETHSYSCEWWWNHHKPWRMVWMCVWWVWVR